MKGLIEVTIVDGRKVLVGINAIVWVSDGFINFSGVENCIIVKETCEEIKKLITEAQRREL